MTADDEAHGRRELPVESPASHPQKRGDVMPGFSHLITHGPGGIMSSTVAQEHIVNTESEQDDEPTLENNGLTEEEHEAIDRLNERFFDIMNEHDALVERFRAACEEADALGMLNYCLDVMEQFGERPMPRCLVKKNGLADDARDDEVDDKDPDELTAEEMIDVLWEKLDVLESRLFDVAFDAARAKDEKRDREFEQMLLDRRLEEIEARLAKLEGAQP